MRRAVTVFFRCGSGRTDFKPAGDPRAGAALARRRTDEPMRGTTLRKLSSRPTRVSTYVRPRSCWTGWGASKPLSFGCLPPGYLACRRYSRKHSAHGHSFADRSSVLVTDALQSHAALTTDRHVRRAGFEGLLPTAWPPEWSAPFSPLQVDLTALRGTALAAGVDRWRDALAGLLALLPGGLQRHGREDAAADGPRPLPSQQSTTRHESAPAGFTRSGRPRRSVAATPLRPRGVLPCPARAVDGLRFRQLHDFPGFRSMLG